MSAARNAQSANVTSPCWATAHPAAEPERNRCLSACSTAQSTATLILPPLTDDQTYMMHKCWRVGDWRPNGIGVRDPLSRNTGSTRATPEEELARMIETVRFHHRHPGDHLHQSQRQRGVWRELSPRPPWHNWHNGTLDYLSPYENRGWPRAEP